jgi:hypothetical protein
MVNTPNLRAYMRDEACFDTILTQCSTKSTAAPVCFYGLTSKIVHGKSLQLSEGAELSLCSLQTFRRQVIERALVSLDTFCELQLSLVHLDEGTENWKVVHPLSREFVTESRMRFVNAGTASVEAEDASRQHSVMAYRTLSEQLEPEQPKTSLETQVFADSYQMGT